MNNLLATKVLWNPIKILFMLPLIPQIEFSTIIRKEMFSQIEAVSQD